MNEAGEWHRPPLLPYLFISHLAHIHNERATAEMRLIRFAFSLSPESRQYIPIAKRYPISMLLSLLALSDKSNTTGIGNGLKQARKREKRRIIPTTATNKSLFLGRKRETQKRERERERDRKGKGNHHAWSNTILIACPTPTTRTTETSDSDRHKRKSVKFEIKSIDSELKIKNCYLYFSMSTQRLPARPTFVGRTANIPTKHKYIVNMYVRVCVCVCFITIEIIIILIAAKIGQYSVEIMFRWTIYAGWVWLAGM